MNLPLPKEFRIVGTATILFVVLPYAIYAVETWAGVLPTQQAWFAQGSNHGPWRWQAEGFTIAYPLVLLALATIVISVARAVGRRQLRLIGVGFGFLGLQISMIALQLLTLFWLID